MSVFDSKIRRVFAGLALLALLTAATATFTGCGGPSDAAESSDPADAADGVGLTYVPQSREAAESTAQQPGERTRERLVEVKLVPVTRGSLSSRIDLVGTLIPIRATTVVSEIDGVIESFPFSGHLLRFADSGRLDELVGSGGLASLGSTGGAPFGGMPGSTAPGSTVPGGVPLGLDIGHWVKADAELVRLREGEHKLALVVAEANQTLLQKQLADLLAWHRPEEVRQLEATLEETKATAQRAEAALKRSEELLQRKAVSQGTHDVAVMEARMARAAVAKSQAALDVAKAGPTESRIAVARAQLEVASAEVELKRDKLNKTVIRAPYDGVVTDRYVDVGDRVTAMPRVEILQLVDPRILFAQVDVPERYLSVVKIGDLAEVSVTGISEKLTGRVDLIGGMIAADTRTFRVRVTIDNRAKTTGPDGTVHVNNDRAGKLKPGGFVHVKLPVATSPKALSVPFDAVSMEAGRPCVFVYEYGKVRKTPVQLGLVAHQRLEVVSGVGEGDQVVAGKTAVLSDGTRVKPMTAEANPRTASSPLLPPGSPDRGEALQ